MGSVNPTERVEIVITTADYYKLSKEDQKFSAQTGDMPMVYALVAKEHGYKIVEWPPRTGSSHVHTVVKL